MKIISTRLQMGIMLVVYCGIDIYAIGRMASSYLLSAMMTMYVYLEALFTLLVE